MTFKQANDIGAKVRKGEKGFPILYFTWLYSYSDPFNENGLKYKSSNLNDFIKWIKKNKKKLGITSSPSVINDFVRENSFPIPKYYKVFNVAQLDNFKLTGIASKKDGFSVNEIAEKIIENYPPKKPKFTESGKKAFYSPSKDLVNMPPKGIFKSEEEFYSTLFHEYIHSTSKKGRLKRPTGSIFGSKKYAAEELVAEIGAVYLSAEAGFMFKTVNNAATYIKGWSKKLTDAISKDNKFFIRACSHAQKAADYILQPDKNGQPKYYKDLKKTAKTTPKKETAKPTPRKRNTATKPKKKQLELFEMSGLNGVDNIFTMANDRSVRKETNTFRLPREIGKLLGDLQAFMLAILVKGDTHSGKSELVTQIADAFLTFGKSVGLFDLEQGGMSSKDTQSAIDRNITPKNQARLAVTGSAPMGIETIKKYASLFDVVIIDSWQKLGIPNTRFDELRQQFPNTIFIVIFQQNGEGGTRGGVSSDYDANVVLKTYKIDATFDNNYTEVLKNRGNTVGVRYSHPKRKFLGLPEIV